MAGDDAQYSNRRGKVRDVEVRAAAASDVEALVPLLAELGYPASASDVAVRLAGLQGPDDTVLVATGRAGQVQGLIGLHRLPVLHVSAPACYITALVVADAARGQGVGRALLTAGEGWARRAGCSRMVVTSAEHRQAAHAFYERAGFPYTGRRFVRPLDAPVTPPARTDESTDAAP